MQLRDLAVGEQFTIPALGNSVFKKTSDREVTDEAYQNEVEAAFQLIALPREEFVKQLAALFERSGPRNAEWVTDPPGGEKNKACLFPSTTTVNHVQ